MRRMVVLGTSGAGKTTVAAALARIHDVPHVDLDAFARELGWAEVPVEAFRARVLEVVEQPGWVVDGDFERKLGDLGLERAETAVWLDLPLRVSLLRMWRRTNHQIHDRVPLAHGNLVAWHPRLLRWVGHEIQSHLRRRLRLPGRLARHPHLTVAHLRSQSEVDAWLASADRS